MKSVGGRRNRQEKELKRERIVSHVVDCVDTTPKDDHTHTYTQFTALKLT